MNVAITAGQAASLITSCLDGQAVIATFVRSQRSVKSPGKQDAAMIIYYS